MKLIIREYLAGLRERDELDALLPDLLSQMGLDVFSKPAVGGRHWCGLYEVSDEYNARNQLEIGRSVPGVCFYAIRAISVAVQVSFADGHRRR